MAEPWSTIVTLAAGFATGVLSGMFGVGGAVVSTPAIRTLGATPLEAVGSTLPSIVPSAVSGSLRYRREGLIIGRVACWTLSIGLAATVGGALLVEDKIYRVATNDFIARGGDGYVTLRDAPRILPDSDSPLLANEVMSHVRRLGTVRTPVEGRIRVR